jgi:hypothetical protein
MILAARNSRSLHYACSSLREEHASVGMTQCEGDFLTDYLSKNLVQGGVDFSIGTISVLHGV